MTHRMLADSIVSQWPLLFLPGLPFLPAGRGALIMMFGGVSMLSSALFLLGVRPSAIPAGSRQPSGQKGLAVAMAHRVNIDPGMPLSAWHRALRRGIHRRTRREVEIRPIDSLTCLVVVRGCRSCLLHRQQCKKEARAIRLAAKRLRRSAEVDEAACRLQGKPDCAFAVTMR